MARRDKSLLRLDAVRVEGALIQPDVLASAASATDKEQTPASYGLERGLNLRDEIGRAYLIAKGLWATFEEGRGGANPDAVYRALANGVLTKVLGFEFPHRRRFAAKAGCDLELLQAAGKVPVALAGADGIDHIEVVTTSGSDPIRRSATTLIQGELNAREGALWGMATNGLTWRILRDNESITRPGYIEIDLARIFRDDLYADFSAFWLIAHRSRFPQEDAAGSDCVLERWRQLGREQGVTAREDLREGVRKALFHFGRGFLENPANKALIDRLNATDKGRLTKEDFFRQLLRLVYRMIFVMTAEDREILYADGADEATKSTYVNGYGTARLRERSRNRLLWDRHHDAFEGMKAVFRALLHGEPKLGLPALGGLFADEQTPDLDGAQLTNKRFLKGLYNIAWLRRDKALSRINWRDMETEEFGSVYESLLELTPVISDGGRLFSFVGQPDEDRLEADRDFDTKDHEGPNGNERKTTGSYYTPDSLVKLLLKEALDPVIETKVAENPGAPNALLALKVIDPACGSGHFVLAAARKIARRISELRHGGAPTISQYRHALRDVAMNCIHGVDRNPMAVELCKVALWIETVEPGMPLGFLDANIRCGDSLVGVFDLKVLETGIPDAAFEALTGDDREVARYYAQKNRREMAEREKIAQGIDFATSSNLTREFINLRAMPETTLVEIEAKAACFKAINVEGTAKMTLARACNLYVAPFLLPKGNGGPLAGPDGLPRRGAETVPTSGTVWESLRDVAPNEVLAVRANDAVLGARAFHWPLEFPDVMAKGGFDIVIGNPPWDVLQLEEDRALDLDGRMKEIFKVAPFDCISGRRDLYKLFLCRLPDLLNANGGAGLLVPVGYLVEEDCRGLREMLWKRGTIEKVIHFQNTRKGFFPAVDARYRFSIIDYKNYNLRKHWFSYTITDKDTIVSDDSGVTLIDQKFERYIETGAYGELHKDLKSLKAHQDIMNSAAFDRTLSFGLTAEWHATTHKSFAVKKTVSGAVPVGKNRDIHKFNDNFGDASFFVSSERAKQRATEKRAVIAEDGSRILIRDIARNDDTVTLISCITTEKVSSYDTPAVQVISKDPMCLQTTKAYLLLGYLNSSFADFLIRPFVDKHIKGYVIARIPVPVIDLDSDAAVCVAHIAMQLTEIGNEMGNETVWRNLQGKILLRALDKAVAELLGLDHKTCDVVRSVFEYLYSDQLGNIKTTETA